MEMLVTIDQTTFRDKRVLVTGHTGFKGAWLCEFLLQLNAKVFGFALAPDNQPSLFELLGLSERMEHQLGDLRDSASVRERLTTADPEVIFHLAAQPIVRRSYADPVETWETNVLGTMHLLENIRTNAAPNLQTIVVVTTDKCYRNVEWDYAYREADPLGGHDPYSASKAATEILVDSYRKSFLAEKNIRIATARAGNVIGGGDWADDRIVPDAIRALAKNKPIPVRNKHATRPWQHVLDPLSGYLALAATLTAGGKNPAAINFGPHADSNRSVGDLIDEILLHWPGEWIDQSDPQAPHEAGKLNLAIEHAWHSLRWTPTWDFSTTIRETVQWYAGCHPCDAEQAKKLTLQQIDVFRAAHRLFT